MIRKFLQEGLTIAMPRCLDESAIMGWNPQTQRDIMRACIAFVELSAEKLKVCLHTSHSSSFLLCVVQKELACNLHNS